MKKILYSVLILLGLLVLVGGSGALYVSKFLPNIPVDQRFQVDSTPELLARGDYLANHVTLCMDCHSTREWGYFSAPPIAGTEGMGGDFIGPEHGAPGMIYTQNITPAALGNWSDAEIARAIVSGVGKEGNALFPMMPYPLYNNLSTDDLKAIIAYMRTVAPIENDVPASTLDFPLDLIVNTMPIPFAQKAAPSPEDSVAYGHYLAQISGCIHCHTQMDDMGQMIPGTEFGGGQPFNIPTGGTVTAANITPDATSGIGSWTREQFIERFKFYATDAGKQIPVQQGEFTTVMPWTMYADMTEEDLASIYAYLRTVEPIQNEIKRWVAKQ